MQHPADGSNAMHCAESNRPSPSASARASPQAPEAACRDGRFMAGSASSRTAPTADIGRPRLRIEGHLPRRIPYSRCRPVAAAGSGRLSDAYLHRTAPQFFGLARRAASARTLGSAPSADRLRDFSAATATPTARRAACRGRPATATPHLSIGPRVAPDACRRAAARLPDQQHQRQQARELPKRRRKARRVKIRVPDDVVRPGLQVLAGRPMIPPAVRVHRGA